MFKIVAAFMVAFLFGSIFHGVMEGGGGVNVTRLAVDHTAAVTTLTVTNTDGFLSASYVQIGNEKITYTGKTDTTFTGCTRGADDTTATTHASGSKAYSPEADVLNSALGYNIATTGATIGAIDIPIMLGRFFTVTVPRLITWDFAWLKAQPGLAYLRYVLMAISVGFLIYVAFRVAVVFGGILQSAWRR